MLNERIGADVMHCCQWPLSVYRFIGIVGVVIMAAGCTVCSRDEASPPKADPFDAAALRADLPPLDLVREPVSSKAIRAYRRFYGLEVPGVRHCIGRFESRGRPIAGQVFFPRHPAGTFVLVHGYFDHAGTMRHLIAACLAKQFAVAVFDLPGHGLSPGDRGAVDSLDDYVSVLADFMDGYAGQLPSPHYLVAHSTGAAVAYDTLSRSPTAGFADVVLLAPLIHHAHWRLGTIGYRLVRPFSDAIPRVRRRNSSDDQFLEFACRDPLQHSRVTVGFLDALHAWNRRIQDYRTIAGPVLVIQGTDDDVVDWRYNIGFLESKVVGLRVDYVPHARHQLANEREAVREDVIRRIFEYVGAQ